MNTAVLFSMISVLSCFTLTVAAEAPSSNRELFSRMDADDSRMISLQEYLQFGRAHQEQAGRPFNETTARETFAKKDANKNGYLTFAEFSAPNKPPSKYKSAEQQRKELAARKKAEAEEKVKADAEEQKKKEAKREENKKKRSVHGGSDESGNGDEGENDNEGL